MGKSEIVFNKYSPLMEVDTPVIGSDGKEVKTERVTSLCRCGKSKYKPYCDGSHAEIHFSGEREDSKKAEPEIHAGKEITIVFDRYLCMGAGFCGELEAVFGTHEKPLYDPDGAPVDEIIKTIRKCPSGALSYIINGKHEKNYYDKASIAVEKDAQLNCRGEIEIKDDQNSDKILPDADHCCLCRCGDSKKKPLCDGSHHSNGFKD